MAAKQGGAALRRAVRVEPVLKLLGGRGSGRKLRLFACACCRRIEPLIREQAGRLAIAAAERFADKLIDRAQLLKSQQAAERVCPSTDIYVYPAENAAVAVSRARITPAAVARLCRWTARKRELKHGPAPGPALVRFLNGVEAKEEQAQFQLLRHLFGNRMQPVNAPAAWSTNVVALAQALYDGDDNRLILADAVEEAGHSELAAHFRQEVWHPKGCWAMDLLLAKE